MTIWHWVRHGPTHQKTFVGWRDVPADLSETAQIARLNAALPRDALVISSDLSRAITTADAITAERTRLPHAYGLREFNFGTWDGRGFAEIAADFPDLSRAYWETPGETAPPGGESWNAAAHRVSTTVDHIARTTRAKHIIAVAHIGVILTQLQRALGCNPAKAISQKIDNLSLTSLDFSDAEPQVIRVNHLP